LSNKRGIISSMIVAVVVLKSISKSDFKLLCQTKAKTCASGTEDPGSNPTRE
jgi:hypothetical protein